jgi:hypothetical protein
MTGPSCIICGDPEIEYRPGIWVCDCPQRGYRSRRDQTRFDVEKNVAKKNCLTATEITAVLLVVALLVTIGMIWNQYTYGDWKCLFTECRRVIEVK